MSLLDVSYDLIAGKNYSRLIAELTRLGGKRELASNWMLDHPWSASQMLVHLQSFIDSDDRLKVTQVFGAPARNPALMFHISGLFARRPQPGNTGNFGLMGAFNPKRPY